jgi:hypothetical protein
MIRLHCSNCEQVLEVDDAFAGGVCRCRHCGAIQTVPADAPRLEAGEDPPAAAPRDRARPLYRREEQQAGPTSGLDELADVVASSGALSSGMARRGRTETAERRTAPSVAPSKPDRRLTIAIGVASILAVLAAGLAISLLSTRGEAGTNDSAQQQTNGPDFLGLPIGRRTIWLVDRGSNSANAFQPINRLILDTVSDLPAGSEFQIVYWMRPDFDERPPAVPGRSLRAVSQTAVSDARRQIDDITTGGSTQLGPALEQALAERPDTLVLITGKAWTLPSDFADTVLTARAASRADGVVIHTLAVDDTSDGTGRPLRRIAEQTGGEFRGFELPAIRQALSD